MIEKETDYLVIQEGGNPSSDYFVIPYLASQLGRKPLVYDLRAQPPDIKSFNARLHLIFVRYISSAWRKWASLHGDQIASVSLFIDDDLFDVKSHSNQSLRYRFKLFWWAARHRAWLKRIGAQLWVANDRLAQKYREWAPTVLELRNPYLSSSDVPTLVFYHGSASHEQEILWLQKVIHQVQAADPDIVFEIIGNRAVRDRFKGEGRVHVLHPMDWASYQALLARPSRAIGLAPLFGGGLNDYRSATKFFDITQAGAVGIYADTAVYRKVVRHQVNGYLLPMDECLWVKTILSLSKAEQERHRLLASATEYAECQR